MLVGGLPAHVGAEGSPQIGPVVDENRRPGRFLLLGSASPQLLRQASESLAGRISFYELAPFDISEISPTHFELQDFWLRGGYPPSWLAKTEQASFAWRESFISTHLERDIPSFGIRVPGTTMRRFWQMLAHLHGQIWLPGLAFRHLLWSTTWAFWRLPIWFGGCFRSMSISASDS